MILLPTNPIQEVSLTSKQLAILRAAVRYFAEEFCPSGPSALENELPGLNVKAADVNELQTQLTTATVQYVNPRQFRKSREPELVPVLVLQSLE